MDKVRQWLYYVLIGTISFIALVFFPMLGSTIGLAWMLPTTIPGWCVWVGTKVLVSIVNVLVFHCFILQGKLNIKDDPKFKEANEILQRVKVKKYIPRSPSKFLAQQYSGKGVSLFLMTAMSLIAFSQAILTFDWVAMLTYLMTVVMGIIFGIIEMKSVEVYWTEEYYDYAKRIEAEEIAQRENQRLLAELEKAEREKALQRENERLMEMASQELNQQRNDMVYTNRGNDILDTSVGACTDSLDNSKPLVVDCSGNSDSILVGPIYSSDTITTCSNNELKENSSEIEE